jgi:hypothetical protein
MAAVAVGVAAVGGPTRARPHRSTAPRDSPARSALPERSGGAETHGPPTCPDPRPVRPCPARPAMEPDRGSNDRTGARTRAGRPDRNRLPPDPAAETGATVEQEVRPSRGPGPVPPIDLLPLPAGTCRRDPSDLTCAPPVPATTGRIRGRPARAPGPTTDRPALAATSPASCRVDPAPARTDRTLARPGPATTGRAQVSDPAAGIARGTTTDPAPVIDPGLTTDPGPETDRAAITGLVGATST